MLTDYERTTEKRQRNAEWRVKVADFWWDRKAYVHQIPPEGEWFFWLLEAGE